jgi:hypothetical protein
MTQITFKTAWRSKADNWSLDGERITDERNLEKIRRVLEKAPILVEHSFYRGSRGPDRRVFDDYANFIEYLQQNAVAGDAIYVWDLQPLLREDKAVAHGKCPAEDGTVPEGGAY